MNYTVVYEFIPNPTIPWWPKIGISFFKEKGDSKNAEGNEGSEMCSEGQTPVQEDWK